MKIGLAIGLLAMLPLAVLAQQPAGVPHPGTEAPSCAPSMGLNFVCGLDQPEDLLQIGGSKWVIASGMGEHGGIFLLDTEAKKARRYFTGTSKPDLKMYPDCAIAPASFNSHGIALRPAKAAGTYTLYSVTHKPSESIQVFAVDARGAEPAISWTGCVKLPGDFRTNAVTAKSDGTILANVQMHGNQLDFISGNVTGGVWAWNPKSKSLNLLKGTELAGNNGIEISPDEKEIYIAVSGTQTVAIYKLADTSKPARTIRTPWYNLDNIHWSGAPNNQRLIAAGMMFDEPACGGTRKQIQDAHGNMNCHRGWVASQLDPKAMSWRILAYGEPNPSFGGIATALVIGKTLWLSSFQMDRVAYQPLPDLRSDATAPTACTPSMGLNYVCGMIRPEDFLQIGSSKYMVFGGSGAGGGVGLIDTDAKSYRQFDLSRAHPDLKLYPDCPSVPDTKVLNAHGISLRPTRMAGLYTLYTVTHAPFESIQVYALDARAGAPTLTWTGCAKLPADFKSNGVTATSDGTIIVNVQMKNGAIQADYMVGKITGGTYVWKPSDKTWHLLPGTELAGNNGIEISKDEKEIYVAVSGTQSVEIYSLANTAKPVRSAKAGWFNIDNIHWSGDRLLTLGVIQDEPACGGTRKEIVERKGNLNCHRGWVAAQLDPASLHWKVLSYGPAISDFGGESTAQLIGDTLWLSSNNTNRVAWRTLPAIK
jgi:sugar lactone lactonase YvrE